MSFEGHICCSFFWGGVLGGRVGPGVLGRLGARLAFGKIRGPGSARSYGISVTTLEEVFLKVASGEAPRPERRDLAGERVGFGRGWGLARS